MSQKRELIEGYVVDLACIRHYPQSEILQRAEQHTRHCALEGHCAESGYGLVDSSGRVAALDPEATARVLELVRNSHRENGIRLRVQRETQGSEMKTVSVEEIN